MKIALLGYGKMGKEIEKIAIERSHEIVLKVDINNLNDLTKENLQKADAVIDFSTPASAYQNIMECFHAQVPIVSGTTGWLEKYDEVVEKCKNDGHTFFYASNYSIGVNIFFKLNEYLANVMNKFKQYEVAIEETHHIHKLDEPSGTAITLAESIINNLDQKKSWKLNGKHKNELGITAHREGEVPGIHEIIYDSDIDFIKIKHSAKSRKGFAFGAVLAAEFIKDKKGVYCMEDIMNS